MSFYLDTSVIINLLMPEPLSERAEAFAKANPTDLLVSDFAGAEFSSVIARRVRSREMTETEGHSALVDFDAWSRRATLRVAINPDDLVQVTMYLRRFDLPLKTPDAVHIAITSRTNAGLATFDRQMASAARTLGLSVADI